MRLTQFCWLTLLILLPACQQKPSHPPSSEVKIGKPYVIEGKTYYPEYDPSYDKIGDASWYGPGFDGNKTASGEIFDQNDITAAHPTLPMPSMVRVTNLKNGHSIIVRINDRGPFRSNRIIDLSKKAAQRLDIKVTTPVRVQYLKHETEAYIASLRNAEKPLDMAQVNQHVEDAKNISVLQSTEPTSEQASGIVESTTSVSHSGQTSSDAAPILTVSSNELASPLPASPSVIDKTHVLKKDVNVQQAWSEKALAVPVAPAAVNNAPGKAAKVIEIEPVDVASAKPVKGNALVLHAKAGTTNAEKAGTLAPSTAKGLSANGNYFVHAGSFASEDNARKLTDKLGSTASTGKVEMGDKIWWRVRLGPFRNKDEANHALDEVRVAGVTDARVTHQ